MSEATSEHSAQPVTADTGFRAVKAELASGVPRKLRATANARRGLRKLKGRR